MLLRGFASWAQKQPKEIISYVIFFPHVGLHVLLCFCSEFHLKVRRFHYRIFTFSFHRWARSSHNREGHVGKVIAGSAAVARISSCICPLLHATLIPPRHKLRVDSSKTCSESEWMASSAWLLGYLVRVSVGHSVKFGRRALVILQILASYVPAGVEILPGIVASTNSLVKNISPEGAIILAKLKEELDKTASLARLAQLCGREVDFAHLNLGMLFWALSHHVAKEVKKFEQVQHAFCSKATAFFYLAATCDEFMFFQIN